jgi:hypothetical protein
MVKVCLKIHICPIIRYGGSRVNVLHREKFNLMFFFLQFYSCVFTGLVAAISIPSVSKYKMF